MQYVANGMLQTRQVHGTLHHSHAQWLRLHDVYSTLMSLTSRTMSGPQTGQAKKWTQQRWTLGGWVEVGYDRLPCWI